MYFTKNYIFNLYSKLVLMQNSHNSEDQFSQLFGNLLGGFQINEPRFGTQNFISSQNQVNNINNFDKPPICILSGKNSSLHDNGYNSKDECQVLDNNHFSKNDKSDTKNYIGQDISFDIAD